MIGYLEGKLISKKPDKILLLVNGIGFEIIISLKTFEKLSPEGEQEKLFIYTLHKDDILNLYGFKSLEEKDFFILLLSLSGIGPKMAISLLSKFDYNSIKKAVASQDVKMLTSMGGIGKKRAEKLLFELKNKIKDIDLISSDTADMNTVQQDAILALESLGFSKVEAVKMISSLKLSGSETIEDIIKNALANRQ